MLFIGGEYRHIDTENSKKNFDEGWDRIFKNDIIENNLSNKNMPIKATTVKGKPALKWGDAGKPYTYTPGNKASRSRAKAKVMKQAAAVEISTGAWKAKKR